MRLIDADKLMADDTFCVGIGCDMCSLSYIDDVHYRRTCGVTKWIINQPTVCDIEQIRKRIRYEANVLDTTKGFAYCSGWMDAFKFALDIINEYTKGAEQGDQE